jgi:lysophospholipase L1-like esterase
MSTQYLNVDQQGDRVTWNKPSPRNGRPALSVFAFGGSTTWGYGVRDDYTLPSLLARRLAQKTDYQVEVLNFGQIGYVSTQEVLLLYQLLAQGMRPDVVVFYDGINDCYAGYQAGIAGLTQNESFRVREFNLVGGNRSRREDLYLTAVRSLLFHSNTARLGRLIGGKDSDEGVGENVQAREELSYLAPHPDHQGEQALEQDVVSRYLFNQQIVEMLGKQFRFRSLFYWQPAVFFKNKLTPFERSFLGDPQREKFFLAAYGRMAAAAPANGVRDLSGIFKNNPEICFTDAWHPTESANELIADSLADDVAKVLAEIQRDRAINPGRVGAGATIPGR